MSVRVSFEIGHVASIRSKATQEGFTHDWEVFVRGSDSHEIGHFVDRVVFHLHETFPKPKRVVKEPPFSVKESGYAGFVIPIDVYLKNKDEPKKIMFQYDLVLHHSGPDTFNVMKEQHVFQTPNDDFKKKLLKGGGFITSNSSYGHDFERNSRDSFTDEKSQLISKPKLSGDSAKKHKPKEHKYDTPRPSSSFVNLFGPPIQKPSKVSPEPKKVTPTPPVQVKTEKKEKEKSSENKEKQKKHEHKDKEKKKEEKEKSKEEKVRSHKEPEKVKEKSNKRPSDRAPSPIPVPPKKKCPSPARRLSSPPSAKPNGPITKDELKHKLAEVEKKSTKDLTELKSDKEKKKKEKKSHDKDKERSSKKEHKKENHKLNKETSKVPPPKEIVKPKEKEREVPNDPPPPPPPKEKPPKPEKPFNKFSIENMMKKPEPVQKPEEPKSKEKVESERKHKHKKKDKKRDENREKHKESKKHKHDRPPKEIPPEPKEMPPPEPEPEPEPDEPIEVEHKEEPASPISIDTSSQSSIANNLKMHDLDDISATSDSNSDSGPDDDEDSKFKSKPSTRPLDPVKVEVKTATEAPPPVAPVTVEREEKAGPSHKEMKKQKDKKHGEEDEKKRRKGKSSKEEESEPKAKTEPKRDPVASGSRLKETKVQDNGVSSSLGEDGEEVVVQPATASPRPERELRDNQFGDLSPDYMLCLKDLQQRIMCIKNNEELERVVNLIAETGRYEVTTQTFDFDLCLLERSTVQQLIALIGLD